MKRKDSNEKLIEIYYFKTNWNCTEFPKSLFVYEEQAYENTTH